MVLTFSDGKSLTRRRSFGEDVVVVAFRIDTLSMSGGLDGARAYENEYSKHNQPRRGMSRK